MTDLNQAETEAARSRRPGRRTGMVSVAIALIAWVAMWVLLSATPAILRANVRDGDSTHFYVGPLILWSIVIALHIIALIVATLALRRQTGKLLGTIAATIGLTGIIGFVLYMIATYWVVPLIR